MINDKSEYYHLIRGITKKAEWDPWIGFVLDAVEKTADFSRKKILTIRDLLDKTLDYA